MPEITLEITGLHKIWGRYNGIEEPYWTFGNPHLIAKEKRLHKKTLQLPQDWFAELGHQHDRCLIVLDTNMGEVTSCENATFYGYFLSRFWQSSILLVFKFAISIGKCEKRH